MAASWGRTGFTYRTAPEIPQTTNDITVTSLDPAAKGKIIMINGTVSLNKNFGAGYTYMVLIEDARVLKR